MQLGMVLHGLDEKGTYIQQMVCALKETIDARAFRSAWQRVMDRHVILRTGFLWKGLEVPVQEVYDGVECPFIYEDWSDLDPEAREDRLLRYNETDRQTGFNVTEAPLMRVALFRFAEEDHRAVWTYHHALLDGRSRFLTLKEVFDIYDADVSGCKLDLKAPRPFSDYIDWIRDQDLVKAEEFWRERLRGFSEPTLLAKRSFDGSDQGIRVDLSHTSERLHLADDTIRKLKELAARCDATVNNVIQAAWALLLGRYTGQDEVVFGATRAGRHWTADDASSMVGLFINTLLMRVGLQPDQSVASFLSEMRAQHLGLRDYEYTPLNKIQEWSELPRGTALFDTIIVFESSQTNEKFKSIGGKWKHRDVQLLEHTNYPLVLGVYAGSGIILNLEYDRRIFDRSMMERMLGHLRTLLESMANDDNQRVKDVEMLTADERRQLLAAWNDTRSEYSRDRCIHQLFESQAEQTPEAIALISANDSLSYEELNRRSNQLAHYLLELGIKAEERVGICVERSIEMIVGIMAVLKAGAAYVPLDPDYPSERLKFISDDARLSLVLTQQRLSPQVANLCNRIVCIDTDWDMVSGMNADNPVVQTSSGAPTYVIYTSGSTGTPKGVLVSHASLVNHSSAFRKIYALGAADRVLQFASINFDVAAEEIFPTLSCGAAVVIPPEKARGSLAGFAKFLNDKKVTVVNLPVPYWREWVIALGELISFVPASIRLVITGSERVSMKDFQLWKKVTDSNIRWLNAYGLTETTITSLVFDPASSETGLKCASVPIGRPIDNTEVYILDRHLQPVPVGIAGELYIGGDCLAIGYLNRPEVMAEKFVASPFSPEARLCKTGDLARYLPDGQIEYLDRADNQVKIRAYRVELGEIESVLASHPGVRAAAVAAHAEESGAVTLAAYVVPAEKGHAESGIQMWPSVGEYPIYDELMYYGLSKDVARTSRYKTAIEQLVKGKTVVEIGTGRDVILARFCISAGAEKVYAIEALENAFEGAKALVDSLGLADRIILLKGFSTEVELPERVDVCVSELIGTIGSSEGVVPILNDARRFLKPGGRMIPERCLTRIAAVQIPDDLLEFPHFSELPAKYADKVFSERGYRFDIRVCLNEFPKENFLSESGIFEDLNFRGKVPAEYSNEVTLNVTKTGKLDGFLLWINLHAAKDLVIDSLEERTSWLPVFFPVFEPGIEVCAGDVVNLVCSSYISENGFNPDYTINGELHQQDGKIVEFTYTSYHHRQHFKKTPFYQRLFSDNGLRKLAAADISAGELRKFLSEFLPAYMIPSAFVELDELPLLPSGKVDRKALPDPEKNTLSRSTGYVAARNTTEQRLIEIWSEVLKIDSIGVHDNFFDLGGHSLQAIRMFSAVEEKFRKNVPLATLFEAGTVEKLAEILDREDWQEPESCIVPIQPTGNKPPFFCIHARGGNVLFYNDLAKHLGENQPFYGVQARRLGGRQLGHATIEEMAEFYIKEMKALQPTGPYYVGGSSFGGLGAFEIAQQLQRAGDEVGILALFDTWIPGHPKLPSTTTVFRSRMYELIRRFEHHYDALKAFDAGEKKKYVLAKLNKAKLGYRRKFVNAFKKAMRWIYRKTKSAGSLPKRYIQLEDQIAKAAAAYQPKLYAGKMTLFRASKQPLGIQPDETLGWRQFVAGGIEIHEVPGHHGSVVAEPYVGVLAEKLAECIDRTLPAQETKRLTAAGAAANK